METFEVAHIRQQNVDLIIVVVAPRFGMLSSDAQHEAVMSLTACARSAGLAGHVVPVWKSGGSFAFLAPPNFHPFFRSLDPMTLAANINRKLTCSGF